MSIGGDFRDVEALKDEHGRRLYSPPRMTRLKAFWQALRAAWEEAYKVWGQAHFTYRKSRQTGIPYLYRSPIPSPTLTIAQEEGIEIDEGVDPDDVTIEIYRDSDGYLWTADMLKNLVEIKDKAGRVIRHETRGGHQVRQDRFTRCMYANMEQAQNLIDEYEAIKENKGLNEEQEQLLAILKRKLREDQGRRDV